MKGFFREVQRINWVQTFFGSFRRTAVTLVLSIPLLVYAASLSYQYYLQLNPQIVYAHKIQTMKQQIGKSISLPKDETPVVATVTDKNILPNERFFSQAEDGDKIFMYKKHKLAILYRPSTGQVITQATLVFQDTTPTPADSLPAGRQVAGASTSAVDSQASVSPAQVLPGTQQNSRTSTYQPQGKVLVQPQ